MPLATNAVSRCLLATTLALVIACGGARPDQGDNEGGGGSAGGGSAGGGSAGGGSANSFVVDVVGGSGSGIYVVGQTVHIWSSVSTANEVALPWSGDVGLLAEPKEWNTSFVMPARAVRFVANKQTQLLTLVVETFTGSTTVAKAVRYLFPPGMRGVALISHGTGGSSRFIESSEEAFALSLALVQRGYGVISAECEETAAGDLNNDGKIRWSTALAASNTDLRNMQAMFASFEQRGLIPPNTPKFALGMSNGGAFSIFLGTVGGSTVASSFPQLRFKAVVSYCADASATRATTSTTPSAWYMCANEDNAEVSNVEARANEQALRNRGVATEYVEHPATPLYDARFTRVGVSVQTSTSLAAELRAGGFVDAQGFLKEDGDLIAQRIQSNPSSFPTFMAQPTSNQASLRAQLKVMRAEHSMYSDYAQRNVAFFDRFNPN